MINPEYLHYLVDGGIFLLIWRGIRAANRWYDVLNEFPPHRHIQENGTTAILYPKGLEPGVVQRGRSGRIGT
jgi:hypothetical protein